MKKMRVSNLEPLLDKPILGSKEFRDNFSDCFKEVVNKKRPIIVGLHSKNTDTATFIPTDILETLLSGFQFHSSVYWDEPTKQYVAVVQEFNGDGVGDTKEEAIEMALDNIEALMEHFFKNAGAFLTFKKYQDLLPLYMRLRIARDREAIAEILGFTK